MKRRFKLNNVSGGIIVGLGLISTYFLMRQYVSNREAIAEFFRVYSPNYIYNNSGEHNEYDGLEETGVKVLCWIMTSPENHKRKAITVKKTWGRRCDKLLFISSKADPELPSIDVTKGEEGRDILWVKTRGAFKYIYENHLDDADWFLKADDDTYVIVENLRYLLKDYDSVDPPVYFGCKFKTNDVKQGYMSGGAGYVLNKGAVKKLMEEALPDTSKCPENGGSEDLEMGKCLENIGVKAGDSRDKSGRHKFLPFIPKYHIIPGFLDESHWYWNHIYYPQSQGLNCCSDAAISFHYIPPNMMYVFEYLIYHLKPHYYGAKKSHQSNLLPNFGT